MDLASRKIILVQQILDIQNENLLDKLESIIDDSATLNSDQKTYIDKGLKSLDKERLSHNQVLNETQERYSKLLK